VDAIPAQNNTICLRDPLGFTDKIIILSPELLFIVSLFDGEHSILDIQTAFTRRFGELLYSDKVREIIDQLDSSLFLESTHFQKVREKVIEEFKKNSVRPNSHAGISYEKDRNGLLEQLKGLFNSPEGPGPIENGMPGNRLRGIIAPHIDIRRGGICYALSYAELYRGGRATTFVILGISHVQTRKRFVLTSKDFDTPIGKMPTDHDFVEKLSKKCTIDFFEDELVHKSEHSVEFQAVFLRYLFQNNDLVRIVPILCSSRDEIYAGRMPEEDRDFREFVDALKSVLAERGDQSCCIAGVDLSHRGQRFGQNIRMTPVFLKQAELDDRKMIDLILNQDADGFFKHIQNEKDRRNVCGVPAIYTLLRLIDAGSARLLRYDQSVDNATQSVVTFMGAAYYD
jgi:AmmeMemoRadiSam system protein B